MTTPTTTPTVWRENLKMENTETEAMETSGETEAEVTLTDTTVTSLDQTITADTSGVEERSTEKQTPAKSRKRGRLQTSVAAGSTQKKKGRKSVVSKNNDGLLFTIILEGKSALQSVLSDWVSRYQTDPEKAMLELIQYFVRCCGCNAVVSQKDFQTQEASTVIRALTENFAEESGDYPLVMTGPQHKKFKSNFIEFVERLISESGETILYDEYMLDTLVMWLVGLSDSQVRAFRHTSTLACLKIVTGLIRVASSVNAEIDNTQRQCETERRRSASRRATGKLEKLETKLQELQQQLTELQEIMNTLFSSVFVHRYRDTRPEIRSICIAELGVWMKDYHTQFLADNYLKYIGWTLSDKVGDVRLNSVQSLIPLYSSSELAPHLELFTQKFKERLVSMRLDNEDSVVVVAISLCCNLLEHDMLEPEECVEICELVFMDNRNIAQAAGKFAVLYLFSEDFMSKARRAKPPKGHKKPTDAQIKLRELVRFFLEAKIHEHAVYMVDSLWEHTEVLQDWESMVSLILDSSCGVVLSSEEETAVIEILACAVKRASRAGHVTGRGRSKQLSAKDRRAVETEREALATELIPILPDLIAKYGTDATCAANLTSIPQQYDLEMYVEMRAQKHLEELLAHLKELMLKHSTTDVLNEISTTYNLLLNPDFTLHSTVDIVFSQLTDDLFSNCKQWMEALKDQSLIDEDNDDVYNLGVNLKRITSLFKQVDLTRWPFTEELINIIEIGVDGNASDMIVVPALTSLHLHILWSLQSLDETKPDRSIMRNIRTLTETLVKNCHNLLKLGSQAAQQEAFVILCDLLMVFAKQLKNRGALGALVHNPDSSLQSTMCDYVMERVFGDAEGDTEPMTDEEAYAQAEKLNDRRVLLSGFLKLVMYSVVEMNVAAPVFGQYVKFFPDYGDLIRTAITRCREASPMKWYRTVLLSLQQLYSTLQEEGSGVINHTSSEWSDLKDLARRIALTTGFDLVKCRHPIVGIHRDGIKFALQDYEKGGDDTTPPNQLDFLDIVSEFSFRLLGIDRTGEKGILAFLRGQLGDGVLEEVVKKEEWKPLLNYLCSLEKYQAGMGATKNGEEHETSVITHSVKKKGGRGTKRKQTQGETETNKSLRLQTPED